MQTSHLTGPVNYVALGDSTGIGVGAKQGGYVARLFKRILDVRPGSKLTNLCVSGASTDDLLRAQLARGIAAKPMLVTVGIGINDIGHGNSPEEFAKNFEEIISRLRSETAAEIIVSNVPDISTAPRIPMLMHAEIERLILLFNQSIHETAARHQVRVVNVYQKTHEMLPGHPEYFSADGFHPSDAGYDVWADVMWPTVAQTLDD